jgi:signal transduction histidine kinase
MADPDWRRAFDALDLPVLLLGPAGAIQYLNAAARALTDRPEDPRSGASLSSLGNHPVLREVRELLEGVEITTETTRCSAKAGAERFDISVRRLTSEEDATLLVQVTNARAPGESRDQTRALVSGVYHDLQNVAFAVSATLEGLEAKLAGRDDLNRYFSVIRTELASLAHLVQHLDHHRDGSKPDPSPQSVRLLVDEAVRMTAPLLEARRVTARTLLDAPAPLLHVDRARTVLAVQLMLEFALLRGTMASPLTVSCAATPSQGWLVTVEDQVKPLRTEELERAGEPFGIKRKELTGLELALVRRIAAEHGGALHLEPLPEGLRMGLQLQGCLV